MPDMSRLEVAERSSAAAYAMSGRKPADIDLAMLYDSFTITVLLTLEAVGLCGRGEGKDFVKGQRTAPGGARSEEHTSELQSLMRISYAVFCLKKKKMIPKRHRARHTR